MFPAKVRLVIYLVTLVLALVCAGLALFGLVTPQQTKDAMVVFGIVFGGVSGLAAKNVNPE